MDTTRFILLIYSLISVCSPQTERVERVGLPIRSAPAGQNIDFSLQALLINDAVLQAGLLFGFSAYFTSTDIVYFQVWRNIDAVNNRFQLINQWQWAPNVVNDREDVYIHLQAGSQCATVQSNDVLGIYAPARNPIAYNFVNTGANVNRFPSNSVPSVGDQVTFDTLQTPYDFSVAAWIDTEAGGSTDCPQTLAIPNGGVIEDVTEPPPAASFGATGSTGSTGPRGAQGPRGTSSTGDTGEIGPQGPNGFTGATGPMGDMGVAGPLGLTGPAGPPGPPGINGTNMGTNADEQAQASTDDDDDDDCDSSFCDMFTSPYVVLALLIWLAILTILFLLCVIVQCCRKDAYGNRYSQSELWKKYENVGYDKKDQENHYAEVEEGKTAF